MKPVSDEDEDDRLDEALDEALEETFPASDPVALTPHRPEPKPREPQAPARPADQRERSDSTRRRFTPKSE